MLKNMFIACVGPHLKTDILVWPPNHIKGYKKGQ